MCAVIALRPVSCCTNTDNCSSLQILDKNILCIIVITKLAKFAAELGKLEKDLKVSKPTKPAPADTNLRSNAAPSSSSKKLAGLEAEANRTGDRTKLIAYKKSLRK